MSAQHQPVALENDRFMREARKGALRLARELREKRTGGFAEPQCAKDILQDNFLDTGDKDVLAGMLRDLHSTIQTGYFAWCAGGDGELLSTAMPEFFASLERRTKAALNLALSNSLAFEAERSES